MARNFCEWRRTLPATLEAMEDLCSDFRTWKSSVCPCRHGFGAELLLREALTNAVVHGSDCNPRASIECVLRLRTDRVLISVRDQGDGFNWRAGWDKQADPNDTNGRGMEILRAYASRVRFNPKGNSVTLLKHLH